MAHYLFNLVDAGLTTAAAQRTRAAELLRLGIWGVDAGERHAGALGAGDLFLTYLGAPAREFVGRATLASALHEWTAAESQAYPGELRQGVRLIAVEEWDQPVPISLVLSSIPPSDKARADFDMGVVRITEDEYDTVIALAHNHRH